MIQLRYLLVAALASIVPATFAAAGELPMLHADGTRFVDTSGQPVILKGCNLGNYLMLESWMFGGTLNQNGEGFRDGVTVNRTLQKRFGDERAAQLMALYRNNWITPRDFDLIKSFGFNVVRLPFDYRLLQNDQPPFDLKPDAFYWLDHAVQMAENAHLYVILDLHGVPGGQSLQDHTGESGQDKIWNSIQDQQRTVMVWKAVSAHFKDDAGIAAYDLMNEPYGNHHEDVRPVMSKLMPQVARAIRDGGDQHIVFFPGVLRDGIAFYGNPHDAGLTNVAFTEHFYPGLFGSTPALETQAQQINRHMPERRAYLQKLQMPYYVGEFNVVLAQEDPQRVMRAYYDRFAEYGWAGTMWSYKLISSGGGVHSGGWYLVTNAEPLPALDLDSSSYEQLAQFFHRLGTVPLAVDEPMRDGLTAADPGPIYLASYSAPPDAAGDAKGAARASLLSNGSFEQAAASADLPAGWDCSGRGINREAAGIRCDVQSGGSVWQQVEVTAGARYTFTVSAQRDAAATGSIELRLECATAHGPVTVNSKKFDLAKLSSGSGWTRLSIPGTAYSGKMRAMIVCTPSESGAGGSARLSNAALTVVGGS